MLAARKQPENEGESKVKGPGRYDAGRYITCA